MALQASPRATRILRGRPSSLLLFAALPLRRGRRRRTRLAHNPARRWSSHWMKRSVARKRTSPNFAAARGEAKATALDRSIARAALLPNAVYHNQFLYTQGNGQGVTIASGWYPDCRRRPYSLRTMRCTSTPARRPSPRRSGLKGVADVRLADATAARAAAEYEIARRGLVATVVGLYFSLTASEHKVP